MLEDEDRDVVEKYGMVVVEEDERLLLCKVVEDAGGQVILEHHPHPLGLHVPEHTNDGCLAWLKAFIALFKTVLHPYIHTKTPPNQRVVSLIL